MYRAPSYVLSQNLIHGDALTMRPHDRQPITFAEVGGSRTSSSLRSGTCRS
jgi:hypothetical protein